MFFDTFAENAQLFFLIFVRIMALVLTAHPHFFEGVFPFCARIGLALFAAIAVFPMVQGAGYPIPDTGSNTQPL